MYSKLYLRKPPVTYVTIKNSMQPTRLIHLISSQIAREVYKESTYY